MADIDITVSIPDENKTVATSYLLKAKPLPKGVALKEHASNLCQKYLKSLMANGKWALDMEVAESSLPTDIVNTK